MKNLLIAVAFLTLFGLPGGAASKDYDMGPAGVLTLDLPPGWTLTRQGSDKPGGAAFRIEPPSGSPLQLLMTPYPAPGGRESQSAARELTGYLAKDLQKTAVENPLKVEEMKGGAVPGYFFSHTDKTVTQPTTTNFKYVDQGVFAHGPVLLQFTILTNLAGGPVRDQARAIVRDARISPPLLAELGPGGLLEIPAPGANWALVLELPGFKMDPIQTLPNGLAVKAYGENPSTGVIFSAFVEPGVAGMSAADYREAAWNDVKGNLNGSERDLRRTVKGPLVTLEYRIPDVEGIPINQKHLNAHMVNEGMTIAIHLSKVRYVPTDDALFGRILASVRIVLHAKGKPKPA